MQDGPWGRAPASNPILAWAAVVGGAGFLLGYVGPLLVSDSNLGPLLGIFVTGPLGALAGALAGLLVSAKRKAPRLATSEVRWLGGAWLATLLLTLFLSFAGISWFALAAQLAVIACAAVLFYRMPAQLPGPVRKSRLVILAGAAVVLATTILPPFIARNGGSGYTIFLDPRFDASTHVPDYVVDQGRLVIIWLVIALVVVLIVLVRRRSGAARP